MQPVVASTSSSTATEAWRVLHERLTSIARNRAALDAEEAQLLRQAAELKLWRHLGYSTAAEYLERELGYAPRTAIERLRVAEALCELPKLAEALANKQVQYTAVRDLSAIATPETEEAWLGRARGKTVRQIRELVRGHRYGDQPDDPTGPSLQRQRRSFELTPATIVLLRQVRLALEKERNERLDDDDFIETLCRRALEPPTEGETKPAYQISVTTCSQCRRGWQNGAGADADLDPAAIELARCDAEDLGSLDAAAPTRVKSTTPARKRRQVFVRDRHRCVVPGCSAARNLDVHHIERRADGGRHEMRNLVLCCSGHHRALHDGKLIITGRAPDKLSFHWAGDARSARVTELATPVLDMPVQASSLRPSLAPSETQPNRRAPRRTLRAKRVRKHGKTVAVKRSARRRSSESARDRR